MKLKTFDHTVGAELPNELQNCLTEIFAIRDVFQKHGLSHLLGSIVYFPKGRPRIMNNQLIGDLSDTGREDQIESITVLQVANVMVGFSNIS